MTSNLWPGSGLAPTPAVHRLRDGGQHPGRGCRPGHRPTGAGRRTVGAAGPRALRPRGPPDRLGAGRPRSITVTITKGGAAELALPRTEVGQGVLTSTAMILAEELDLPSTRSTSRLAPARPELLLNQLTGGSNTTFSTYTPIRVAAAIARQRLLDAAAILFGTTADRLTTTGGVISDTVGNQATYGDLAESAASQVVEAVEVILRPKGGSRSSAARATGPTRAPPSPGPSGAHRPAGARAPCRRWCAAPRGTAAPRRP